MVMGVTFSSLTVSQQKQIEDLSTSCRSFSSQLSKLCILGSAIASNWSGGTATLVASLNSGEIIPNTTGLDGAQDLSPADVSNLAGYATTISNPSNSPNGNSNDSTAGSYSSAFIKALLVKACGINAFIGNG